MKFVCQFIITVLCVLNVFEPTAECPKPNGIFPNTINCTSFYLCTDGVHHKQECPGGLHYNRKKVKCDFPKKAKCKKVWSQRKKKPVTKPPATEKPKRRQSKHCPLKDGLFPNPANCSTFYFCVDGVDFLQECPQGLVYDIKNVKCDFPRIVGCKPPSGTLTMLRCPEEDGLFRHPTECSKFFLCKRGRSYKYHCPEDLVFDYNSKRCDYSRNIKCPGTKMTPPCFSDLGKQARDIFSKNYHIGVVKLECKTKTSTGVNFTVSGSSNNDTGRVNAFLETKYLVKDYGLTIKEKWTTDNVLATQLSVEDQFVKGLKLTLDTSFAPQSGKKAGTVQTAFKNEHVHLNGDVDLDPAAPQLHSAGVIKYQNWLIGAKLSHDFSKNTLTKTNVGVGYSLGDFVFHSSVVDGHEFGGCMYQKVNDKLESGMTLTWTAGTNETRFGLGCNYKIDDDTSFRAKVNNSSQIGLSFTHRLKQGIHLTLSSLIDGKNFNQGGHKIGLGLELEG